MHREQKGTESGKCVGASKETLTLKVMTWGEREINHGNDIMGKCS